MGWLHDWERIEIPGHAGGTYVDDGSPWRMVLHSTEGLTMEGAIDSYKGSGVPPTGTIDPKKLRKAQHIDTDRSAYALRNLAGGVETNRLHCVQIEIVMFADHAKAQQYGGLYVGDLTDEHYSFIRACILDFQADKPFTLDGPEFVAYPESYGLHAPQRMTAEQWRVFPGVCAHEHVPENDHGDVGAMDRRRLFPPTSPVPTQGETVPAAFQYGQDLDTFQVDPTGELVTRYYQANAWHRTVLAPDCLVGSVPVVVRDFAGQRGRLDVFVEHKVAGQVHAWFVSGPNGWVWLSEILT